MSAWINEIVRQIKGFLPPAMHDSTADPSHIVHRLEHLAAVAGRAEQLENALQEMEHPFDASEYRLMHERAARAERLLAGVRSKTALDVVAEKMEAEDRARKAEEALRVCKTAWADYGNNVWVHTGDPTNFKDDVGIVEFIDAALVSDGAGKA